MFSNKRYWFFKKIFPFIVTLCICPQTVFAENPVIGNLGNVAVEEVVVTAQRREQSLLEVPIAISVLNQQQLELQGISSLGDLMNGTIPSLHMQPYANAPSTLVIAIRGNGPGDVGQTTRDGSVAVYLDEIYLARSQALDFELAEIERIEVLRGPQGTLYGRNATSGAINLISKKPTGEFGLRQTVNFGRYDLKSSTTHLDFPSLNNIKAKIDLLLSEQDGWVENTASNQSDFNEIKKSGGRLSLDWDISQSLALSYRFNNSNTKMSQNYYQFYRDFPGEFGNEENRENKTRLDITPLVPSESDQKLHSVTLDWEVSDSVSFESLSSYREMVNHDHTNFGGTLYFNGYNDRVDVDQDQLSQEFRLLGNHNNLDWVVGIYYYEESVDETIQQFFTLDILGLINIGDKKSAINPPSNFDVFAGEEGEFIDPRAVSSNLESLSIYSQATYTPPVLDERLYLTLGARYTDEEKSGRQTLGGDVVYQLDDNRLDPAFTLGFFASDNMNVYGKWSRAFRSGGVNVRSPNLIPFTREEVDTAEIGIKMEGWDKRLRFNAAAFNTDYEGMFIDVYDPDDLVISDTINADNKVEVDGFEFELTLAPISGLVTNLNYTYLDGEMPLQPNSLSTTGLLEEFNITQTPKHAGSLTVDYQFLPTSFGIFSVHTEIISRSLYHHFPSGGKARPDGYNLINARVELSDIPAFGDSSSLKLALWAKNLQDEEYVISSFHFEGASTIQAFGEPRTFGVELKYEI